MSKLTKQTLLLIAVPLAFLVLLLLLSLTLEQRNVLAAAQSQQSAQALADAGRTIELLDDADRALGTYAKTKDVKAVRSYRDVAAQIASTLRDMEVLERANPSLHRRALAFAGVVERGVGVLDRYLAALQRGDVAAQRRITNSPEVRRLNVEISGRLSDFENAQRRSALLAFNKLRRQIQAFTIALLVVSLLGVVVTLAVALRFGLSITRRVLLLAQNAKRLADGQPTVPLGGNDEISRLDAAYRHMAETITSEQHRVATLQHALLPARLPAFPGLRLDASYVPAAGEAEIGGDWYDVFRISSRRIGISIGDVAGHGLRAAATMASARHAIRSFAYFSESPAHVLEQVNQVLSRDESVALVTAFYATLDLLDGTLRYAFAGHPAPIIVKTGGSVEHLPGSGFVLGVEPRTEFTAYDAQMEIGSALVLYTDGLVERDGEYFEGVRDLEDAVECEYRESSGNIAQAIQRRALAGRQARDDCAILFVGITALGRDAIEPERVRWTLDARSETSARRVKRAVLWHLGQVAGLGADLALPEMILSEMLGNVARHTPGPAEVTLERDGNDVTIRVYDEGPPFEPPAEGGAADLLAESGRGIFLMRAMSRSFSVARANNGNCVSVMLPIRANADAAYSALAS